MFVWTGLYRVLDEIVKQRLETGTMQAAVAINRLSQSIVDTYGIELSWLLRNRLAALYGLHLCAYASGPAKSASLTSWCSVMQTTHEDKTSIGLEPIWW